MYGCDGIAMDPYDIGAVYYDWDDKAIQLLKDCLNEASAKIVISSGWRDFNHEEKLKALFQIHDLDSYIIDVLPKGNKEFYYTSMVDKTPHFFAVQTVTAVINVGL